MSKRIALLDADSLLYAAAARAEAPIGDGEYITLKSPAEAYKDVEARLETLKDEAECDDAIICLSSPTNFRKTILETYKANRKLVHKPLLLPELRAKVQGEKPFPVVVVRDLEADDVCGISAGSMLKAGREAVIVSIDKDLQQIPGLLYNPNRTRAGNKRPIEEISEASADRTHLYQTLIGDVVDNYTGCPGVGPVKALALLNQLEELLPHERWVEVCKLFVDRGYSAEYALTQSQVSRILRVTDWDIKNKRPILWTPPPSLPE